MERLQKVLAHAGIGSRRKCEQYILEGRVKVNGTLIKELGYKVQQKDKIEFDHVPIYREEPVYFLFYKPKQVLSAVADERGRKVVTDFFSEVKERIYPVGRLDYDTTGVLLLTNDGEFSYQMTHPKHGIEKTYIAKVKGIPLPRQMRELERGIKLDGRKTSSAIARIISVDTAKGTGIVSLTIHEGWNHQVKRMFEHVGLPVQKLKRERFGFLTVDQMKPGEWRTLKNFEIQKLLQIANQSKT